MATEQRLIDANELKEKMQEHHDFFVDGVGGFRYLTPKDKARVDEINHCIAEITNTPTVDAVEVPDKELLLAIKLLIKQYEHSKNSEYVHSPVAHALYHTWRQVDERRIDHV